MEMVRLNDLPLLREAWERLQSLGTVVVSFGAQGTHTPLLIVDAWRVWHVGYDKQMGYGGSLRNQYHYVGVLAFGGLYPLTLHQVHPGYVQEKLRINNIADARNVAAFLTLMGSASPEDLEQKQQALKLANDHLDHDYYNTNPWRV